MDTKTQQIIILILGICLVGFIIKDEINYAMYIIMILATAITGKSLTEKQGEIIEEQVQNKVQGIVKDTVNNKIDNILDEQIEQILEDDEKQ